MALDEASTALLTQLGESGLPPISDMTPEQARSLGPALAEMYGPGPDVEHVVEPAEAPVPVRVIVPGGTPRGVVVYYHGGGWVIGALDEFETLGRTLAVRTGCVVVLVDYRLAPEHRYPTAVDDAWSALRWVDEHAETLAGARVPVIVAGDSAGGNLAAIVARRARDAGGPSLAGQVLVYPVTDANVDRRSYVDPANQLLVSRAAMIWFWGHYAPDPAQRGEPDASPLRAEDLGGLPPAARPARRARPAARRGPGLRRPPLRGRDQRRDAARPRPDARLLHPADPARGRRGDGLRRRADREAPDVLSSAVPSSARSPRR